MDKNNKIILIAIAVLVVVLAVALIAFSGHDDSKANDNAVNISENTSNITADVIKTDVNKTADNKNTSGNASKDNVKNTSSKNQGWKWSDKLNTYVNNFVDSNGNLHIQVIDNDGKVQEIEYKTDGSVYSDGKNITGKDKYFN